VLKNVKLYGIPFTLMSFFYVFAPFILNIKIPLLKPTDALFVIISTLKQIKITLYTATCFGPRRDHPQGVPQCLAKTMYMFPCARQCRRGQCYGSISTCRVGVCTLRRQDGVLILPPQCAHTKTTG
jgi:hypothetical protein